MNYMLVPETSMMRDPNWYKIVVMEHVTQGFNWIGFFLTSVDPAVAVLGYSNLKDSIGSSLEAL